MTFSNPTACRRCISQNITCAPLRDGSELVQSMLATFHTLFLDICPLASYIFWSRREERMCRIDGLKKKRSFVLLLLILEEKKGLEGV